MVSLEIQSTGEFSLQPLGWVVRGVIAPCDAHWAILPRGLVCCDQGIVVVKRNIAGFLSVGVSAGFGIPSQPNPDSVADLACRLRSGHPEVHTREQIAAITLRWRQFKCEICIDLKNQERFKYWIFARRALPEYRQLLNNVYGSLYHEAGFESWWAKVGA